MYAASNTSQVFLPTQEHCVWLSRHSHCLTLHSEPDFEKIEFSDAGAMRDAVFEYIRGGYHVK